MDKLSNDYDNVLNCTDVTVHQMNVAALTRGITGIICFVLCLLALFLQVIFVCRSKNTNTLERLFLYLTISTVFYMGVLSLQLEHYFRYEGQDTFCAVIGVLNQYLGSIQLLITLGITLKLFHKLLSLSKTYKHCISRFSLSLGHSKCIKQHYCYEVVLCIVSLLLPWTVIWVPFLSEEGSYGISGPVCWIKAVKDPLTCQEISRTLLQKMLLWYVPFGLVAFISLLCILCVLGFFCYLRFQIGILRKQSQIIIKEMVFLLVSLVVFFFAWLSESTIRAVLTIPHTNSFVLWMVCAIVAPISGTVVPVSFVVYLFYSKFSSPSSNTSCGMTAEEYSNLETGKDGKRFIHNPSRVSAASHTNNRDYNYLFSPYDEFSSIDGQETRQFVDSTCHSSKL